MASVTDSSFSGLLAAQRWTGRVIQKGLRPELPEPVFFGCPRSRVRDPKSLPFLDPRAHFPGGRFGRGIASNFAISSSFLALRRVPPAHTSSPPSLHFSS